MNENKRFCSGCGKEIEGNSPFCPSCGMRQAGPTPAAQKPKKKTNPLVIVAIVIGVLILLGLLGSCARTISNLSDDSYTGDDSGSISSGGAYKTVTSSNVGDFITELTSGSEEYDGKSIRVVGLTVTDGKPAYPGGLSSYVIECDNADSLSLREGKKVNITGNLRGYGLDNFDILIGLTDCKVS